jgi:hypothetical protein
VPFCSLCQTPLDAGDCSCWKCGGLSDDASVAGHIACGNHPGQHAIAACVVCGKPVCGDCAVKSGEMFFCEDLEHRSIRADWVPIYSCASEFESDIIERNLQQAGVEPRVFSKGDHLELSWAHQKPIVRVWTVKAKATEAQRLLRELGLIGDDDLSRSPSEGTIR